MMTALTLVIVWLLSLFSIYSYGKVNGKDEEQKKNDQQDKEKIEKACHIMASADYLRLRKKYKIK